jgi:hypothetical protein
MNKKVLSEIDLYFGQVKMPEGFEIDREKLCVDILLSVNDNYKFSFSKTWDMLQTYLREHIRLEHGFTLIS